MTDLYESRFLVAYSATKTYWAKDGSCVVVLEIPTTQWFRLGCPLRLQVGTVTFV